MRLSEGKLSGLANMARWGDATLETKYDENVSSIIDLINNIESLNLRFLQNHMSSLVEVAVSLAIARTYACQVR